jgi:hypothetical protein
VRKLLEKFPRRKILGEKCSWEKKVPRRKRFLGEEEFILAGTSPVSRWSNGGTGEWKSLENRRRWRMEVAGE